MERSLDNLKFLVGTHTIPPKISQEDLQSLLSINPETLEEFITTCGARSGENMFFHCILYGVDDDRFISSLEDIDGETLLKIKKIFPHLEDIIDAILK